MSISQFPHPSRSSEDNVYMQDAFLEVQFKQKGLKMPLDGVGCSIRIAHYFWSNAIAFEAFLTTLIMDVRAVIRQSPALRYAIGSVILGDINLSVSCSERIKRPVMSFRL